ncbi:MAG: TIGR03943 family protein [Herpetosiphon sp.]
MTERQGTNWSAAIEGWILVGIATMLLRKLYDRQLTLYTHPRYLPLIGVTAVLVLVIGVARLWLISATWQSAGGRVSLYGLLLLPLLLGTLVPAKPAGSALIDPRQLNNLQGRPYRGSSPLSEADSTRWTLLDWMFARYTLKPEEATGRPADLVGFVYHVPHAAASEFNVVRYAVVCCVADRSGASLPVHWEHGAELGNDQWVRVQGTIALRNGDGLPEYVIEAATVTVVDQPAQPYLYP